MGSLPKRADTVLAVTMHGCMQQAIQLLLFHRHSQTPATQVAAAVPADDVMAEGITALAGMPLLLCSRMLL